MAWLCANAWDAKEGKELFLDPGLMTRQVLIEIGGDR
jgi:hypothetical protein